MPDFSGLRVRANWQELESYLRRRSLRGWALLAFGLGVYLVGMVAARLLLPRGHQALIPIEYALVHLLIYFPIPLLFALSDRQRVTRDVLPWLLAATVPVAVAALAKGDLLHYAGTYRWIGQGFELLKVAVNPLGFGFWVTVLFAIKWQKSCPSGLAELGFAPIERQRHLLHAALGAGAALVLLVHLCLTMLLSGHGLPAWVGPGALWDKGGLTLAQECLGEELFYRGFFFLYLRRLNWSFWPAALLVAGFDAAHFLFLPGTLGNLSTLVGFVYYVFVYSVVNCALIDRTKSVLAPWAANALFTMVNAMLILGL